MEVYIEYVILDNLIIDFFIIYFTGLILSKKFKKLNMCFSILIGVLSAVLLPLISIDLKYLLLVKFVVAICMVLILKKYANFKEFLSVCIAHISCTFLFGGICLGVMEMFNIKHQGSEILLNGYSFPMSFFILIASGYIYLTIKLIRYVKNREKLQNFYFDVVIVQNNKNYYLRGYLDTGNKLFDKDSPVVIVSWVSFTKIFRDYPLEKIPLGKAPFNPHYLQTLSVGGDNKILVMDLDEVRVNNKTFTNVKLGISHNRLSSDFDVLLHSTF